MAGALLTRWVPGHWLMFLVAVAVAGVGVEMLRLNPYTAAESARRSARWRSAPVLGLLAVAIGVGVLSGLLANGGGFLLVPAFVLLFGASMREAAATSLICVAFLAVPGTVTHALLGHIDWLVIVLPGQWSHPGDISWRPSISLAAAGPPQATLRRIPFPVCSILPGDGDIRKRATVALGRARCPGPPPLDARPALLVE